MRKYLFLIAWVVGLSLALSACQRLPKAREWTCAELLATPLQSYIGQAFAVDALAEAIVKVYGIPRQEMSVNTHDDGSWFVSWTRNGLGHGASSESGMTLDAIGIDYQSSAVSSRRIIDCVGSSPEWYSAQFGLRAPTTEMGYSLILYFPAQGLVANGNVHSSRKAPPPSLSADFLMEHLFIGTLDSFPALYEQRWGTPIDAARPAWQPVPWPGDWGAIHWVEDR